VQNLIARLIGEERRIHPNEKEREKTVAFKTTLRRCNKCYKQRHNTVKQSYQSKTRFNYDVSSATKMDI